MAKGVIREIKLDRNNLTLLDVLSDTDYYQLNNLDIKVIDQILKGKDVLVKGLVSSDSYQSVFAYFENIQNKERAIQLVLTHGVAHINKERVGFVPMVLIPVYLYRDKDDFYIRRNGSPFENPNLFKYLKDYYVQSFSTHHINFNSNGYDLDTFCIQFSGIKGLTIQFENHFGYVLTDYPSVIIDHSRFSLNLNEEHFNDHFISSSNKAALYSSLSPRQISAVERAINGNSFAITGPIGSGKSEILFNILCNSIANDKKILYLSGKKSSKDIVAKRLKSLQINYIDADYVQDKESISKEPLEVYNDNFLKELKDNYKVIDEYEANINGRIYGLRILDCLDTLISLNDFTKEYKISDSFKLIEKHEYEDSLKELDTIDEVLKNIDVPSKSIFANMPLDNDVKTFFHPMNVLQTLIDALKGCIKYRNDLIADYRFKKVDTLASLKSLLSDALRLDFKTTPSRWYEGGFDTFKKASNTLPDLNKDIDNINNALHLLDDGYQGYSNIDITEYYNLLLGDFFSDSELDTVDYILSNVLNYNEFLNNIRKERDNIESFYNKLHSRNIFRGKYDNDYFDTLKDIKEYCENAYYYNVWCDHLYDNYLDRLLSREAKLDAYYTIIEKLSYYQIDYTNQNIKLSLQKAASKGKSFKRLSIVETKDALSLLESPSFDVDKDKLEKEYFNLAGKEYVKGESVQNDFIGLREFIKRYDKRRVDDVKRIFQDQNEKELLKSINDTFNYASSLKEVLDPFLNLIKKEIDLSTPFDIIERSNEIEKYVTSIIDLNDRMSHIVKNGGAVIGVASYVDLMDKTYKYNDFVSNLNNDLYDSLYGELYNEDLTEEEKVIKHVIDMHAYLDCFQDEESCLKTLSHDGNQDILRVILEGKSAVSNLDRAIEAYGKIFKDDIGTLLYGDFESILSMTSKMHENVDELKDYIKISHALNKLNEYGLNTFVSDIYNGNVKDCKKTFQVDYLSTIYNEYKDTHRLDSLACWDSLCNIDLLESDLIKNNLKNLTRKSRSNHYSLTLSSIPYFTCYLDATDFDLVIVDDASVYDADDYSKVFKIKQVILAGESSFRFSQSNNVITRLRDENIMSLRYRYLSSPFELLNMFKNLHGVIGMEEDSPVKCLDTDACSIILELLRDKDVKINYFSDNKEKNRMLFNDLVNGLVLRNYSITEALDILRDNINIASIESGYTIQSDYNIIDYNSYSDTFISDLVAWISNCALAKKRIIFLTNKSYDEILNDINEYNDEFLVKFVNATLSVNKNISPSISNIYNHLEQKGFNNIGTYGDITLISEDSVSRLLLLVSGDSYSGSNTVYDLYKDYYVTTKNSKQIPFLIFIQDIYEAEDELIRNIMSKSDKHA